MKIPRDVSGQELAKSLRVLGYERVRQEGSHVRMTSQLDGEHHVTIPDHANLKIGTLKAILKMVANHHRMSLEQLLIKLDL